jgi:DNA topoisomerase IA/intein/homing endonuclease
MQPKKPTSLQIEQKEYRIFNPETIRQLVEIPVKPKPSADELEKVEIVGKPRKEKKPKKENKKEAKDTEKIKLNPKGHILIITEKPQAAAKIAAALSNGNETKKSDNGIPYYELERNNKKIIIACAVGHLFTISQNQKGTDYPIFDIGWFPNFEVKKKDFTKKYYLTIKKLVKGAGEIVIATDFDTEGEVIGYNIIRFIAHQADAKRMKFSSLTAKELQDSYDNALPAIEWGQAIAGETRHFLDWLYGINLSRALMNSIKKTGKFRIMSIGRVQGPALNLIVEKEKQIQAFKSAPYWQVFLSINDGKNKTDVKYIKDIAKKQELDKFKSLEGKKAIAKTTKTKESIIPPAPFDLTALQTEAYKFFSINPAQTLQIAQSLYLAGLISYPRTSSQKIPESMEPKKILERLSKNFEETKKITRQKPVEGKKSDPAHPCFTEDTKISIKDNEIIFRDIIKNIKDWKYDENKKSFYSEVNIKNISSYNHKENIFTYSEAYKILKTPFDSNMINIKDINLKVTPNHPIYSINEKGIDYVNSEKLGKGDYVFKKRMIKEKEYKIKISKTDILNAYSKNHKEQINKKLNPRIEKSYNQVTKTIEKLTLEKTIILSKIIGFCMGDGHIHFKKPTEKRENYPEVSFIGKNEDMAELKKDIEYLGFSAFLRIIKKNPEYSYLASKNSNFGRILISLGCPYGDKVSTKFNVPEWIINSEKEIKSAFIGGLFSAELTKTRIHLKNPRDIRPFTFTQNKNESLKNSFIKYLKTLKKILLEFKIKTSEIKTKKKTIRKKDNKMTIEGIFDIKNNRENLIRFLSAIDFGYCKYKEKSYRKALAYLLYREIIIVKKNKLKEKHISTRDIPKFEDFHDEIPEGCIPIKIKNLKKIDFKGFVYDLEIKDTHNFFANNILVHNCIMPTGIFQKLEDRDYKIYNLIVKRFISCFCDNVELENKKIEVEIDNLKFNERGMEIIKSGWMEVYPSKMIEKEIKDFNGEVDIEKVKIEEKMTQPPKRYSPASIITELEKKSLGTKSTRANIIETLYDRNYIKEKSIQATELGIRLIDSLKKYSPIIIDERLTREIEKDMDNMRESKKDLNKKEKITIDKARDALIKISKDFKKNESAIGKELVEANESIWKQEKENSKLGIKCPGCNKGELSLKFTPRFKSYFIACSEYPNCRQTFPLPSRSLIKKIDKICGQCSYPMLMSIRKGKRPWIFCFNPQCPSRQNKENK